MHKKITTGFVSQTYVTMGGKHICIDQKFVGGDQIDYEDDIGNHIDVDTSKEQYQPFDMKDPPTTCSKKGLIFTCPSCQSHRLECCEDGPYSSEVVNIDEEGDFDYGEIEGSGNVSRFQCLNCGYILEEENDYAPETNEGVVQWILGHCEQPRGYTTIAEKMKNREE